MDKCREEFDCWIIENNKSIPIPNFIMKNENGEYVDRQTADLWIGWKASRENMKAIKLPVLPITMPINYRIGFSNAVNRCEDAITSAGYEVEE